MQYAPFKMIHKGGVWKDQRDEPEPIHSVRATMQCWFFTGADQKASHLASAEFL